MKSNTLLSSPPDCASCVYRAGHAHKTTEQRVLEFYGHMPTREEIERDRPERDRPERVSWGAPVGREVW